MRVRHEYRLDLAVANFRADLPAPVGMIVRAVASGDVRNLAELMLDAFRNTIDDEGEDLAAAIAEVERYFARALQNPAIAQHSLALGSSNSIACACLLECWPSRDVPFVGFVMCRSTHKQQGLATFALHQAAGRLKRAGYPELRAIITEGNHPSEALFSRAGFQRADQ